MEFLVMENDDRFQVKSITAGKEKKSTDFGRSVYTVSNQ
jgi:hypothetical protein